MLCGLAGRKLHRTVHRLVALAFIPNPDGKPHVNHINGDRSDSAASNLEWVTARENSERKVNPAKSIRGRGVVQLTREGAFVREWPKIADAAAALGLNRDSIGKCCQHRPNFRTCGGFVWEYSESHHLQPEEEVWRALPRGAAVSSLGRIRTCNKGITYGTSAGGYLAYGKVLVHRLVAMNFPELCPKPERADVVNHRDGNRHNNRASNLEWMAQKENVNHAFDIGLTSTRVPVRRISTSGEVRDYVSLSEAARQNCLSAGNISEVCSGKQKSAGGYKWSRIQPPASPTRTEVCGGLTGTALPALSDEELGGLLSELGF